MKAKVIISNQGKEFLNKGQTWMYRNNLIDIIGNPSDGDIVDIIDENYNYIATGFYSICSHIVVRIISYDSDSIYNYDYYKEKIVFAYNYRKTLCSDNIDNIRLIYSEADGIPGLIVDRYNDILVTQISIKGIERIKDLIYKILIEVLKEDNQIINSIYERNDISSRLKEGLETYKGYYIGAKESTTTIIKENDIKIKVDFQNGQKTGYFLDQKSNRYLLRKMSKGKKVLDCFSHTGGFALNCAKGEAYLVDAIDVSKTALNQGLENAIMNGLEKKINFIQDDVFDYLDHCKVNQYDIIILDPPAFTKSRKTVKKAYNGYKRINKQAMKLLKGGGYLVSCSCSRFMETSLYEQMLREAAKEANVTLKQVSVTQQNSDHPILWTMEETSYLKFYIFQIV